MDFHPLLVHFPIALFITYAFVELCSTTSLRQKEWWLKLRLFLVWAGVAAAIPTIAAGLMAEDGALARGIPQNVIEMHETFATVGAGVFLFLGLVRALEIKHKFPLLVRYFGNRAVSSIFAILGIVCITITGGLGAYMVFGPDVDPFVRFIANLVL